MGRILQKETKETKGALLPPWEGSSGEGMHGAWGVVHEGARGAIPVPPSDLLDSLDLTNSPAMYNDCP